MLIGKIVMDKKINKLGIFRRIEKKITSDGRLSFEDGLALFQSNDLHRIGYLAI